MRIALGVVSALSLVGLGAGIGFWWARRRYRQQVSAAHAVIAETLAVLYRQNALIEKHLRQADGQSRARRHASGLSIH